MNQAEVSEVSERSDNLTPEQRHRCMSRVRTKNTLPEIRLRTALHNRGARFRNHMAGLPGRPDIVFTRAKLAVFVDGDFWHGRELHAWAHQLSPFWRAKIARNITRDEQNTADLQDLGWAVLRVWEYEIEKDVHATADEVIRLYRNRLEALTRSQTNQRLRQELPGPSL